MPTQMSLFRPSNCSQLRSVVILNQKWELRGIEMRLLLCIISRSTVFRYMKTDQHSVATFVFYFFQETTSNCVFSVE